MKTVYNLTMKRFILSLFMIMALLHAEGPQKHIRLPYDKAMALLESIKSDAIVLGEGKTEVYVFVDPLCPHSRKFMTMVSGNASMLSKYRYYIYLYSIPRLKSEAVVSAIYASKKPAETLLRVMVGKETIPTDPSAPAAKAVSEIAAVAEKIDVYKRPYLIVAKQQ
jgi:hypothetical protein